MKSLCVLLFFLLSISSSFGQSIFLGLNGGGRTNNQPPPFYETTHYTNPYFVGAMADFELPHHLGLTVDLIYNPHAYAPYAFYGSQVGYTYTSARANIWEVPFLVSYGKPIGKIKPFVTGGLAFRLTHGSTDNDSSYQDIFGGEVTSSHSHTLMNWPTTYGIVGGGGARFKLGPFYLTPELRYTQWNQGISFTNQYISFTSTKKQLQVLVSVAVRIR